MSSVLLDLDDVEVPFRENFALLPPETPLIMYIVLIPFAAVFLIGIYRRLERYGWSALGEALRNPRQFAGRVFRYSILQVKVLGEWSAGFMHLAVSYGILVLFIGTLLVFIDNDIFEPMGLKLLIGSPYLLFEAILDLFGIIFITGITIQLVRRIFMRDRLRPRPEYILMVSSLWFIGLSGFLLEGIRIALQKPEWSNYSFIGASLSSLIISWNLPANLLNQIYLILWWAHALVVFGLVAYLPYSNLRHTLIAILYSGLTWKTPRLPKIAETPFKLEDLDEGGAEEVEVGFRRIGELNWLQKMGLDACVDCGRCEYECPAYASGTPLSPRNLVQKLQNHMWRDEGLDLIESGVVSHDEVYACTTCGACVSACPITISPLEYIMESRRAVVMDGRLGRKAAETLNNLIKTGNPFGLPRGERRKLVEELRELGVKTLEENPSAEYVYWVGCLSTYDHRLRSIAKKTAEILGKAGVSFAIIGEAETCNGEPARRLGEEGLFQELAYQNIETLRKHGVRKLIVHCPHCYQIFRNEYRELGLDLEVIHHSELLGRLVREGRIKPKTGETITLHDSCYLSRYNKVVDEPRLALSGLNLVEMRRCRENTFCCGGGGGSYWSEVKRVKRESVQRVEEALETGADVIVTECPYCLSMIEDALRTLGMEGRVKAKDLSELF